MTSEVSTSSLSDIMFFLMLFFLLMSTMVAPSVLKLNLPKSDSGKSMSKQSIVLAVDSNNNYYLNNQKVEFAEIEPKLLSLAQADTAKEATVVFKANGNMTYQELVDVMSIGPKLKMKMVLATDRK
ncbi:MAG: biopolymer transporter ExbD [Chitinophagales bacterium]